MGYIRLSSGFSYLLSPVYEIGNVFLRPDHFFLVVGNNQVTVVANQGTVSQINEAFVVQTHFEFESDQETLRIPTPDLG